MNKYISYLYNCKSVYYKSTPFIYKFFVYIYVPVYQRYKTG